MNTQAIAEKLEALKAELEATGATVKITIKVAEPTPDELDWALLRSENAAMGEKIDELAELLDRLGLGELVHGNISMARFNELREKLK